jgi:putative membrane protein
VDIKTFFVEFRLTQTLRKVLIVSLIVGLYTIFPILFHWHGMFANIEKLSVGLQTFVALILSLLLVFRANRAYERWWEARCLWGTLINRSTNLAMKINCFIKPSQTVAQNFAENIIQFAMSLKNGLRNQNTPPKASYIANFNVEQMPLYFCNRIYKELQFYNKQGVISDYQFMMLDQELSKFMQVAGGCHKIKNTLISLSYRSFVHHIMVLFFLIIPWQFVETLEIWTAPLMIVIVYITFSLEGIARDLEQPFGDSFDHIHMEKYTQSIKQSVNQILISSQQEMLCNIKTK